MIIYIVWQPDYVNNDNLNSHILGIYKTRKAALKKYNSLSKTIIENDAISSDSCGLLGEFNGYGNKDIYYCTTLSILDGAKKIYFMKINESGGGGSYHLVSWLYASTSKKELIDDALEYFNNEHNRDNECSECINDKCKQNLINDLKKKYYTEFDCSDYEPAYIRIWSSVI